MPETRDSIIARLDSLIAAYERRIEGLKLALWLSCKVHAGDEKDESAEEWVATFTDDACARLAAKDGGNATDSDGIQGRLEDMADVFVVALDMACSKMANDKHLGRVYANNMFAEFTLGAMRKLFPEAGGEE
jgi:hypothetical protein